MNTWWNSIVCDIEKCNLDKMFCLALRSVNYSIYGHNPAEYFLEASSFLFMVLGRECVSEKSP